MTTRKTKPAPRTRRPARKNTAKGSLPSPGKRSSQAGGKEAAPPRPDTAPVDGDVLAANKAPAKTEAAVREKAESSTLPPVAEYRMRMDLVGRLLRSAIGELPNTRGVDAVGRGAYLHLMGAVFEALEGLSLAIPVEDLVKLSKVIAEQRRAELGSRKLESIGSDAAPRRRTAPAFRETSVESADADFETRRLPARFGEIVRQVYGTSFAGDVTSPRENAENSGDAGL